MTTPFFGSGGSGDYSFTGFKLEDYPPLVASTALGLQGLGTGGVNNPNQYINPPGDARLTSIIQKTKSQLKQGLIQQHDSVVTGDQKYPFACRFMFNPNQISVSYSVASTQFDGAAKEPGIDDATSFVGVGATTIAFSLLFDRTYEVGYGTPGSDLAKVGVYRDVAALEQVIGARDPFASGASNVAKNMTVKPVYILFGGGLGPGLAYVAQIDSVNVTYGLFSAGMVPTRCGVDISATMLLGKDPGELKAKGGTLIERAGAGGSTLTGGFSARGSNVVVRTR